MKTLSTDRTLKPFLVATTAFLLLALFLPVKTAAHIVGY